jgi:hypothetical protein
MEAERRSLGEIFLEVFTRCVDYSALDCPIEQILFRSSGKI